MAVLLAAILAAGMSGCAAKKSSKTEFNTDIKFPITDADITLTYWMPLNPKVTSFATSFSDVLCYRELEKATGIKLEFQHPSVGQENEQFNLMMASKNLPDLIYYNWSGVSGGVDLFIDEGTILRLNDYLADLAPSYNALLEQSPQARRETQTDDGDIYMFPGAENAGDARRVVYCLKGDQGARPERQRHCGRNPACLQKNGGD